ncbi:MAG: type II secretion system protein [Bacilli bacterium]|nr:type II secretion system protein [Bacilli bacterium]
MKHKNNKGFTLIEILAAVVILGIISAIAVPAVYKYVTKTKDFSYENMYKTVYDAVKNYRIDTNDDSVKGDKVPTYTKNDINEFVELNYLDSLIDPADRSKKCSAEVYVFDCHDDDKTVLRDHVYSVQLTCSAHSSARIFNDNGDFLSDAEIASCIGGGDGNVGNFTVEDADLKFEDKNGADYDGKWTNKNVWLGNFKVKGINLSDVDHFEYSTTVKSSVDVNAEAISLGTNAKQYRFTGDTNVSFRVRAVDKNGRVSVWSDKVFRVRIDRVSPEVTMELIDSNSNFTSPKYKGTATSNTYTHDNWVGGSGSAIPNVRIRAKDDKSGINEELKVNYNTSGDFSNFNTNWNGVSGSKKFKDGNVFVANGLDDGFRVIECTVTDKAGNKTTGTIRVKIDATAPAVTMKIANSNNNFSSPSFKGTSTKNVYIHDSWVGKSDSGNPKVRISAEDNGAGINEEFDIKYNATDDYSNFNTNWTNQSGSRKFKTNNKFTSKEIGGGFRVIECTVTDKAGNVTRGTIKVKIDTVAPSVTMAMVYGDNKSTTGCTSKKFTGSGDGNTDTCSDWVKKNGNNKVKVMITATDSGKLKDNLEVYYNTAGDYKNFNKMWNNSSGSKNFESDSTFTSNEIIDGYRVIKCVVKDEAGNTTEGIINVKIDTKPPTIKLDLKTASKSTLLKSYSCSDSACDKSYTNGDNDWVNKSVKDTVSFSDNGSGTSSLKARYNEAGKSSNNGKMSEWSTRENDSSVTIKDGDRYMEYQATDVAGNTTTLKFSVKKDTEPPKIKVSFIGNKNNDNKTMFTADFTATDDENRSEYASSLEYEYDPWVNSYNDIVGETITVSDALSGVKKDAKIKRTLYNSTYSYTQALKNAATTTDDWSYTSNYERTIKYSDTYLADGYRVFTYQVKDQAGNVATYKVKFKIDKTPPTGWVQVLDKDGKAIAFKSGTTQITQEVTFSKTLTDPVGLKIHGEDVTSGVGAYFNIGFNKSGKKTCAIDDTINTTSSYSFSDITYNNDDISTKATRVIKNAFYNGCRYFKVTLTDIAGNKKTIKIKLTQDTTQAAETVKADTNPVGCHYYDYYVRRTGYSWGCTCGSTHSSSTGGHFVVCKHTDGKYYGKKEYYRKVKNNKTKELSPTLICPYSPKPADGDIANHKFLSKEISDTINWDYYGSTVSGKKWSNW